ncbi:thiamine phosphate synthase [Sphingosinicella microcystinivorans]|uniref:Thiamine-phosphate synthase n=1 Tax=Sphingosinicella microcystinivorans TaxID=335406 RepID=A0AAD1G1M3_SPHMI|nr:thiamine phosphate synthase [Sphingosinicella microcystinivorans]RKS91888.1 thiamine-phosphate diphosphorylase [Sphingosinicella microcystinivorans]BBE34874.1 thiamine-phosphate synthase [Sphingosinicella microcystinivorans]
MDDEVALDPRFADRFGREPRPPCQLYLISPERYDPGFPEKLKAALDAGVVAAFQLRLKGVEDMEILRAGAALKPILAAYDVAFILNDRADLAKELGADGVHLGQTDGSVAEARSLLGHDAQIGVTCHDSRHLAMEAGEAGADYVAFGAFYPTSTKATTHRPDPSILSWWTTISEIPCVAIGGITAENASPLIEAGADFLAVSGAVWNADPASAVRDFAKLLK